MLDLPKRSSTIKYKDGILVIDNTKEIPLEAFTPEIMAQIGAVAGNKRIKICAKTLLSSEQLEEFSAAQRATGKKKLTLDKPAVAEASGTYSGHEIIDAEQVTKNKLYLYAKDKGGSKSAFRFLMRNVDGIWKIEHAQAHWDGWQRWGL